MYVLDASAILAVLLDETGADAVKPHLRTAEVSIINVSEVLATSVDKGGDIDEVQRILDSFGFRTRSFRDAHARETARLRPATKSLGLGIGDRACLAQGRLSGRPILTGDTDWALLDPSLGLDIRLFR